MLDLITHPAPPPRADVSGVPCRRTPSILLRSVGALAAVLLLAACGNTRVARIDPTSVTDLSGRWNDADSRLVANALITQSLDAAWAAQYSAANGGRTPTVIVGPFSNRTMEHIPVQTFTRDL
jgi:penicillin-binding protein activator